MDKKIIAIAAVAILAVAAVGTALVLMNNGGKKAEGKDFETSEGVLLIYGNANEDKNLDAADVTAIKALMDEGKYSKVADANMDGTIDQKDIDIVNLMIEGKSTKAYYLDRTDGATAIDFPIDSFMGIHQFVLLPMTAIGAMKYMKGYTLSSNGVAGATMLQELYDTQTNVNTSYNMVDVEKLSSLPEKPKVMMTYSLSLSNEAKLEKSGIQIMHLQFGDFKGSASAIRTAGFLLKLKAEADEYVKFTEDCVKNISEKILSKITDDQRKTVICGYMTNCIDHSNGSYTPMAEAAGGKGLMNDDSNNYVEFNRGDEWILSYNEDMFFYMNSWGYTEDINLAENYKKSADYFTGLKSYKEGKFVVINSIMPPVLTTCYMAEAMYPDLVGAGYGNEMNQQFIEKFFPTFALTFTATDYDYMITYDMVKDKL